MPPLEIEFTSRFRAEARALPTERQESIEQALDSLRGAFGKPHLHGGLGIRRLKRDYFEFRAGRDTRVVFSLEGSVATLRMVGTHDDVRKFLRNS